MKGNRARNIRELLSHAEDHLVQSGVPNARRNAEWMLCHTLGLSMLDLYVQSSASLPTDRVQEYWRRVERRAHREPLQYILGSTEFMSLAFDLQAGVFVPRPETEILVERAEARLRSVPLDEPLRALDLCCGSGIIGISLAHRIPNLHVLSVDVSPAALTVTAHNVLKHGLADRMSVVGSDAFAFLAMWPEKYQAILCNPPYIETGQLAALPPEVREHEPMRALDGGCDGLDFYRRVIPLAALRLKPGAFLMFEVGDTQAAAVTALLVDAGFADVEITKDLSGRDRVVTARQETTDG